MLPVAFVLFCLSILSVKCTEPAAATWAPPKLEDVAIEKLKQNLQKYGSSGFQEKQQIGQDVRSLIDGQQVTLLAQEISMTEEGPCRDFMMSQAEAFLKNWFLASECPPVLEFIKTEVAKTAMTPEDVTKLRAEIVEEFKRLQPVNDLLANLPITGKRFLPHNQLVYDAFTGVSGVLKTRLQKLVDDGKQLEDEELKDVQKTLKQLEAMLAHMEKLADSDEKAKLDIQDVQPRLESAKKDLETIKDLFIKAGGDRWNWRPWAIGFVVLVVVALGGVFGYKHFTKEKEHGLPL